MKLIWIWFQEWNKQGNTTSYGGERDFKNKEELQEWLDNYIPNFEGCTLIWDYLELDGDIISVNNFDVVNATQRIEEIIGE